MAVCLSVCLLACHSEGGVRPSYNLFSLAGTVIGGNIMLGFYSIFDRENKRIGFAQSTCDCKAYTSRISQLVFIIKVFFYGRSRRHGRGAIYSWTVYER